MRTHHGTMTSALFIIALVLPLVSSTLLQESPAPDSGRRLSSPHELPNLTGRLEYKLTEGDSPDGPKQNTVLSYLSAFLQKTGIVEKFLRLFIKPKDEDHPVIHGVPSHSSNVYQIPLQPQFDAEKFKFESSFSRDAPPRSVPVGVKHQLKDEEWAETLFGPTGVLTAIFHIMDDRRKDSMPRHKASEATRIDPKYEEQLKKLYAEAENKSSVQADLLSPPDFLSKAKPMDFAKIFEAFLTGSQDGFEDPIGELPEFLGICNRLSCGDIYKAIDQFRKSDFFSNFQTALTLIQDPKGWEILGDLLSNPELISQFAGGSGLDKFIGSGITESKARKIKRPSAEIGPEDGNLGTDFSSLVEGKKPPKEKKPDEFELPEIAESVDNVDYYSAVEHGEDKDGDNGGAETVVKPDETISIAEVEKPKNLENVEISLPDIEESIDEHVETVTKTDVVDVSSVMKPTTNSTSRHAT